MVCTAHPKYKAIREPQCDCLTCWIMWEAKQSKNEIQPKPQHGREPKPLAQYLSEYLDHEQRDNEENCGFIPGIDVDFQGQSISVCTWELEAILKQALEAYQSTENVTIKIERKT